MVLQGRANKLHLVKRRNVPSNSVLTFWGLIGHESFIGKTSIIRFVSFVIEVLDSLGFLEKLLLTLLKLQSVAAIISSFFFLQKTLNSKVKI